MTAASETKTQVFLAWLVVLVMIVLIALGLAWYGLSADVYHRMWNDIVERPGGPMAFRFFLQPTMAAIAALHDGINDARLGRSPYFWTILTDRDERRGRLREGLISTARVILLGFGMDAIYQFTVLKTFYPVEMLIIALLLAFVPYLLLRGPIARIVRWCSGNVVAGGIPRGSAWSRLRRNLNGNCSPSSFSHGARGCRSSAERRPDRGQD